MKFRIIQKELRRLAKAQQAQAAALQAGSTATSPVVAQPQPIPAGAAGGVPYRGASGTPQIPQPASSAATPKPVGTPRPISIAPRPGSTVPRPSSTVPRPTSAAPPNANMTVKQEPRLTTPTQMPTTMVATPSRTATATPTSTDPSRGKKRERDDSSAGATPLNGAPPDSHVNMNGIVNGVGNGTAKVNVKPGVAGVLPRPVKKQRMVSCALYRYTFLETLNLWF